MSLITEVAEYLEDNSVGTIGSDLFAPYSPDIDGAMVAVRDTGGQQPNAYIPLKKPTFQVFVRGISYSAGKTKLDAIRALLHQQVNVQLVASGIYFYYILAASEGGWIGRNENGMHEFTMNFTCETR